MKLKFTVLLAIAAMFVSSVALASEWLTDFEQAKQQAADKGVPILADFSGSDWCIWCKRLDSEVFSKDNFKKFADENLVLFLADFPQSKQLPPALEKQNRMLMQQYSIRGFPTVLLLDADGNVLATTGYQKGGASNYIEHLKDLLAKSK